MKFSIKSNGPGVGFVTKNTRPNEELLILKRGLFTSSDSSFPIYIDKICSHYLTKIEQPISEDYISHLVIVERKKGETSIYTNEDVKIQIQITNKRPFKAGEKVFFNDIGDIRKLQLVDIDLTDSNSIILCIKAGWEFILFFDFTAEGSKIDTQRMNVDLGIAYLKTLYRNIYGVFQNSPKYSEMLKDGWFPFIELMKTDYENLVQYYSDKFDFDNKINKLVMEFDKTRIEKVATKWWEKEVFIEKKQIIKTAIENFNINSPEGNISCIKILHSEIEGMLRLIYTSLTGKAPTKNIKFPEFLDTLQKRAKIKATHDFSLTFPTEFIDYVRTHFLAEFDQSKNVTPLSRHTTLHGVAAVKEYDRQRALQSILILDQIYYYI